MNSYKDAIINREDLYTRGFAGASLVFELYKTDPVTSKLDSLIARGTGLSWSEQYQNFPVQEWGHNAVTEIVIGAMQPGQLQFNSVFYFKLNDKLPTFHNIREFREMTAIVYVAKDFADLNATEYRNRVVDYFVGVYLTGQQSNWNAQSMALRNGTMMFRERYSPEDYYKTIKGEN